MAVGSATDATGSSTVLTETWNGQTWKRAPGEDDDDLDEEEDDC